MSRKTHMTRALRLLVIAAFLSIALLQDAFAQAQTCGNPIACENLLPGNPDTDWDLYNGTDPSILGFATAISVNKGETVNFKVNTPASSYQIDIFRLGYYQGNGGRKIATVLPTAKLPQSQPACLTDDTTGLIDCGNWAVSASWAVPASAVSGVYVALLTRLDTGGNSHMFFVVRDDTSNSDVLFQTSDTTWQAYNDYGGNSLYSSATLAAGRAYKVSYNRPYTNRYSGLAGSNFSQVFNAEYPMIRWLEANGYNVSYTTGVDTDRRGVAALNTHKVFLSVGHDEYWSGQQRSNIEAARNAGLNLAFFSGNEVFWKTRWENSIDGSGTPYRTLVTYKETHANQRTDPLDPTTWTGTWRDPRFSVAPTQDGLAVADGGRPENSLTGTLFMVNGTDNEALTVPSTYSKLRFWRNTSVASLGSGQTASLSAGCACVLGYEWDEELDNGFHPAGLVRMSSTTATVAGLLQDYGSNYALGSATHTLTLYRAGANGGLVFGSGTVDWAWALDGTHDNTASTPEPALQQATVNLLADMNAQPATLQPGLIAATAGTNRTPPTSTIGSPANGATVTSGSTVTISGTATGANGGVVAGVEVSADGGATWHPATGTTSWTYTWTPSVLGVVTLKSRAVDDGANLEVPAAGNSVTVQPRKCPCSIWSPSATPGIDSSSDSQAVELGVKFTSDSSGYIRGIRFYKGAGNTGTHVGNLWTSTGTLLATATFTGETASGWQQVNFATPVAISANTTYVASYHTNVGGYSEDQNYFGSATNNPPLHALSSGSSGGNGVYVYGAGSSFPNNTFNASNYWVDLVFSTSLAAPASTSQQAGPAMGASTTVTMRPNPLSHAAGGSTAPTPTTGE